MHRSLKVVDEVPDGERADSADAVFRSSYDQSSASLHVFYTPLVLERRRLAAPTLLRLMQVLKPSRQISVVAEPTDSMFDELLPTAVKPST